MTTRLKRNWGSRLLLAVLAVTAGLRLAAAETAAVPEYQLKAAFIYNFAKFIAWPASSFEGPDSPMVLAILGEEPFGPALPQMLAGKAVNGHPIQVVYCPAGAPLPACHVLFVSNSETERLLDVLAQVAGRPVLTVGDVDQFAHRGGMINLLIEGRAIRFEINSNATEHAGLKVSSKLGGLGIIVRGNLVKGGAP